MLELFGVGVVRRLRQRRLIGVRLIWGPWPVWRVRICVVLLGVSAVVRGICLNPLPID